MKLVEYFTSKNLKTKVLRRILGGIILLFVLTGIICSKSIKSILLKEKYNTIKSISSENISLLSSSINQTAMQLFTEKISLEQIHQYPRLQRRTIVLDKLRKLLDYNTDLMSIWSDWEPMAIDSLDSKMLNTLGATNTGKFVATLIRKNNSIELANYNNDGDEEGEYYTIPKNTRKLYIAPPYFEKYNSDKNYLLISLSLPIIVKNEVVGVVGGDIDIGKLNQQIISRLKEENGRFFIVGPDQKLLIYDKEENVGKEISAVLVNENSNNEELITAIKSKTSGFYDFIDSDGQEYTAYISESSIFTKGEVNVLLIPSSFLTTANLRIFITALSLLLGVGLLIFYLLITYILKNIIGPVNKVNKCLKELGNGNYSKVTEIEIKTGDELEAMAQSFNNLYISIEEAVVFANNIGTGNLSASLESKGEGDLLGNSLINMRDSLLKAAKEEQLRKQEDEWQAWIERGLSIFGQELRQDYNDVKTLYSGVIKHIVSYIDANQGALYLVKEDEEHNKCFEMVACIAWDRFKMKKSTFLLEEGLLGACYFEKAPIELTEIPDNYVQISSGLGGANPRMLMLIPLIHNEEIVGIIEVASFNLFDKHTKIYLERITENFAASITSIKINARTNELLTISQLQAEEMKAQEEEMRQNIEELHATQEEIKRKANKVDHFQNAIDQNFITLVVNRDLVIVELNEKAEALLGHNLSSIIGNPLLNYVHENERHMLESKLSEAKQNKVVSSKITLLGNNKQEKNIQATLISDYEHDGNISLVAYALN